MSKTIYNKCNFDITVEIPSMPSGLVEVEPIKFVGDTLKPIEQASLGKVEPDDATKEAIQSVANAQYKQRQAKYEKVEAEAEAKTKVAN